LKLPAIIGDNMVLQQKQANPIWGWDTPGTEVTVKFAGQTKTAKAGAEGKWTVKLDPVPANAKPATISIKGSSAKELKNVLVGEVWICSGQSNMQWMSVSSTWDADLEIATAKYPEHPPHLRAAGRHAGAAEGLQRRVEGVLAADGRRFQRRRLFLRPRAAQDARRARRSHQQRLGRQRAEAWVRRGVLEKDPRFQASIMATWKKTEATSPPTPFEKQYEPISPRWNWKQAR
jgi:sialate O-acetylesterase